MSLDLVCEKKKNVFSGETERDFDAVYKKNVLGVTRWCLYKVDESMDEPLTSRVDPSWSMNRTHGSIKSRVTVGRT